MHVGRGEDALFVEDIGVGQVVLQNGGVDAPAVQDVVGIVELGTRAVRRTDAQGRTIRSLGRKAVECGRRLLDEGGLQDEVLRLVAGQEHLGQGDKVASRGAARLPRGAGLGGVARKVAEDRVHLRHGQAEGVGHRHLRTGARARRVA